jgi:hypothetical protein
VTPGIEEATGTPRPDPGAPIEGSDDRDAVAREAHERDAPDTLAATVAATRFAHASEAEMARILDFYGVRWDYEPTTFPILWNTDGDVVESFAPDFYLPDLEMYLEMTTLKQRLVRKKNRKLRRLRELYPDIRIKLFYARDFRAMMLKYGRYALFEAISGTSGQVVPERAIPQPAIEVPATGAEVPVTAPVTPTEEAPVTPPALPGAIPRPRSARRRRRRQAVIEIGAEQESGA